MTVFKGYMRIMKKNTGLILLYLCIFFGVTMALQAAAGKETYTSYESEKIKIGVVDKDNGPLAEGLVKWFENTHHVTMLEDNREKLQEELFYRNIEYIVVIPEDFYESCMVNGESISVTKVPGSYSAYYVDQQLENCLNTMRTYLEAGFSKEEAAAAILDEKRGEVTMLDTDGNGSTPGWLYYFRYMPYLFLAVLCYVMGYVLMAFKKDDIPKRMQASAVSARRQSLEGLLAMFVMGGGLWGIGMAGAILMYGKTFPPLLLMKTTHISGCHSYVWKNISRFRELRILCTEHSGDDGSGTFSFLPDRAFCKKQQHVKRDCQYPVSWNVFSVWCFCSHECYGQKCPEGVSVSSCILV